MTNNEKFLAAGRRVIAAEAEGLSALGDALGDSFAAALDLLLRAKGRVIVSGIGKSGHIARKIAATFASTGTPAQFVHPAEASHGDLGMVTSADVVVAISNSGEAPELANMLAYTRRFAIPLIAITSKPESSLARQADIILLLPQLGEACGTGIVPTISTTMSIALGDALAVALMEYRTFTPEDFKDFHPGGTLGARLSKVSDLMHVGDAIPLVNQDTPMSEVLLTISKKGFGVAGVASDDRALVGIITDGDLRRHMSGLLEMTAAQVMTPKPTTIAPDALAEQAVAMMNTHKITCLFALTAGPNPAIAGILHIHDCLRAGVI